MAFIRIVEVFPPLIPGPELGGTRDVPHWLKEIREVADFSDVFLVASLKDHDLIKMSPIESSYLIQHELKVPAAPVIVVGGLTRPELLSLVFSSASLGLRTVMLALGDKDPSQDRGRRSYHTLARAIRDVSNATSSWGKPLRILAPVDLRSLEDPKGIEMSKSRLSAGASLLLAQPPTTDARRTFGDHLRLVRSAGLSGKVAFNIFPFRDPEDVEDREKKFGWAIDDKVRKTAAKGRGALLREERAVVRRISAAKLPGVYVSTRGKPSFAKSLLS